MEMKILGMSCRLEIIIISLIVGSILGCHLLCSCSRVGMQEGMAVMGASVDYVMGADTANSWTSKANTYAASMGYNDASSKYAQNKGSPLPLPEGQLDMFVDTEFKPECCPSTYSSSTGCACMTTEQISYINERGGNRTMAPAEY
jgi:hypothetical protein